MSESVRLRLAQDGLAGVTAAAWDACAGDQQPFLSHAFLRALEESRSVGAASGWQPLHLLAEDAGGRLIGAVPLYLKDHSYGEYVFDQPWADAFERAGGRYYPKLQVAVPFTPVPGPRLLLHPEANAATLVPRLIAALEQVADQLGVSSVHVTFPQAQDWQQLGAAGWLQRLGHQYHWTNHGYGSFDDFLGALKARKRKAIRHERQQALAGGIRIEVLIGDQLKPEHWEAMYRFYLDTGERKWGQPYLRRAFFHRLGATLADRVVLMLAAKEGQWIAGALNLLGRDTLYGRHWGAAGEFPCLHFELCYYQAIEFAIARGLSRVEAGAQGEHKLQRGYLPVPTYSAHWLANPGFRAAVADYLERERPLVRQTMDALALESPYHASPPGALSD